MGDKPTYHALEYKPKDAVDPLWKKLANGSVPMALAQDPKVRSVAISSAQADLKGLERSIREKKKELRQREREATFIDRLHEFYSEHMPEKGFRGAIPTNESLASIKKRIKWVEARSANITNAKLPSFDRHWFDLRSVPGSDDRHLIDFAKDLEARNLLQPPYDEFCLVAGKPGRGEVFSTLALFMRYDAGLVFECCAQLSSRKDTGLVYDEKSELDSEFAIDFTYEFFGLLASGSTVTEPTLTQTGERHVGGPYVGDLHTTVRLNAPRGNSDYQGGSHRSPRAHWRRGHIRRLPQGGFAKVRPCLVGLSDRGLVSKDYRA